MSIWDAGIVVIIVLFAMSGIKNGFFKQIVLTVGTILVFILSWQFKDIVANFLSYNLPFFDFPGTFNGLETANIILYQMIGFLIVFVVLSAIFAIVLKITGIFEKLLKITIIGGAISKVLGFIIGVIEGYVIVFIILFFFSQPAVNLNIQNKSRLADKIVVNSPILSNTVRETNNTVMELYNLADTYKKDNNKDKFNKNSVDIMLKNKMIKVEYIDKLITKGKLKTKGYEDILRKYR